MASKKQKRNADIINLSGSLNPDTLDLEGAKALYDNNADWYNEIKGKVDNKKKLSSDEQTAWDTFKKYEEVSNRQAEASTPKAPVTNTEPQVAETWQDRIKSGTATDEDMETGYQEYKAGRYTPGPKTKAIFDAREPKTNSNPYSTEAAMDKALETNTVPENALDKGDTSSIVENPLGSYNDKVKTQKEQSKQSTNEALNQAKENYDVDGKKGKIKSASLLNMGMDAGDSIANVFKLLDNKNKDSDVVGAKEKKKVSEKALKEAEKMDRYQKALLKKANSEKDAYQKSYDEAVAKKTALQQQLESMTPIDFTDEDKSQVEAINAERANVDNTLQPIADEINAVANSEMSPEEQMKQLDEIISKNGAQLQDIGNTIIGLENKNLEIYKKYAEQTNNKDALKGIKTIEKYQNDIGSIFNIDENGNLIANLTDEGKQQLMNSIKEATDIINNDDSALALKSAVRDMNSDVSRFVRFAVQDMASALLLVCGFASGSPDMIRLGLDIGINRINNAYVDAETGAKEDILNAGVKTTVNDITAESDANYQFVMNNPDLAKTLTEAGIQNKAQQEMLISAITNAWKTYNKEIEAQPDADRKAALALYTSQQLTKQTGGSGWAAIVDKVLSGAALNEGWLSNLLKGSTESHAEGGIVGQANGASMGPDNTMINAREGEMVLNADQQKRLFDILNGNQAIETKGKTSNIMDGILSRGAKKEEPKEEKVDFSQSPAMRMSKQQMLNAALAQRNANPMQNVKTQAPQPKQQKGWGKA